MICTYGASRSSLTSSWRHSLLAAQPGRRTGVLVSSCCHIELVACGLQLYGFFSGGGGSRDQTVQRPGGLSAAASANGQGRPPARHGRARVVTHLPPGQPTAPAIAATRPASPQSFAAAHHQPPA